MISRMKRRRMRMRSKIALQLPKLNIAKCSRDFRQVREGGE
jgi:hypothetical protein